MNNSYFYRDTGYQWSRVLDSSGADGSYGTTTDSQGNIYTTGFYTGTPIIEDHSGNNIALLPVSVSQAAFITKFGFDGRYHWSRILDSAGVDTSFSCSTDSQLNVYFGGSYNGTPTLKDEYGTTLATFPTSTTESGFLIKLDTFGNFLYARIIDINGQDAVYSVACDTSNVFVCGAMTSGGTNIKDQAGTTLATIPAGSYFDQNFIVKFDSIGTYQWYANFDINTPGASLYSIACDTQSNVYIAAQSSSPTNRFLGSNIAAFLYPVTTTGGGFLIKLSTTGNHLWTRIISPMSTLSSVALDFTNNVYVTGVYSTATTVTVINEAGTLLNTLTIPSTGNGLLMSKFNITGNLLYTRTIDSILSDAGIGVACDPYASVYVCGFYNGSPFIRNDTNSNVAILPTSINQSAFLTKFSSNGVYQYSRIIDSSNVDSGQSIVCNRLGTVYFSGIYNGTPTIKNQSNLYIGTLPASQANAMFLSSFSPDGNYVPDNAQFIQCQIFNSLGNDFVNTLRCDRRDNLYAGGFFQTGNLIVTDQFSSNLGNIIQSNVSPGFISKFAANGVLLNSIVITGNIIGQTVEGLATDNNSNLYASGHYRGNGGIFTSTGILSNSLPFTPNNSFDAYLLKFRENGSLIYGRIISSISNNFANCVACEPNGNVYIAGSYSNILSIRNELGTTLVTTTANTIMTINNGYIVKYNPNGVFQWARVISSNNSNFTNINKIACDSTSNLYVTGLYNSNASILTQNAVSIGTLRSCQGESGFCIKFDTLGNILNIITIDSSLSDLGQSVVCDYENNLYFGGIYRSNAILYNNTSVITSISNTGANSSIFVSKFTPNGSLLFTRIIDDINNTEFMRNITCDVYNNFYVCGSYTGTPIVRNINGEIISTFPTSSTESGFVAKFNSSGAFHYSRHLDTTGIDDTRDVECDSGGNLFFCGSYLGSATLRNQEGTLLANLPVSSNTSGYIMELATEGTVYQTYEYPSNVLTSRDAIVINSTYGNGKYTYFTSSNTLPDLNLFDKTSNIWTSGNTFSTVSPFGYTGINSVLVRDTQTVLIGEIIEFKCPLSMIPTGYTLQTQSSNVSNPTTWYMLGYDENRNFTILDYRFSVPLQVLQTKLFNVYTTRAFIGYTLLIQNVFGNAGFASLVEFKVMGSYISRDVICRNLLCSSTSNSLTLSASINTDGTYNLSYNAQSNTFTNSNVYGTATRSELLTGKTIGNLNLESSKIHNLFISYNGTLVSPLSNNFTTTPQGPVPSSPVLFVSANSTYAGASIPNTSTNNTGISTWGAFTAINNPIYYSTFGPSARPCVYFSGGTGAGKPYMTCSVSTNNASTQGKTVFAYLYDPTGSVFTRFFLAGGLDIVFQGGGQTSLSFNNTFDFDINTKTNITRNSWITLCWRGSVNGTGCIEDVFQNGTLVKTYTSTSPLVNGTWQTFGRSEFGDTFNDPYWNGYLYSLLVYDRSLTNSEISSLDNNFRTGIL